MDGKLLTTNVFYNFSFCVSSTAFATFAFDDTIKEMGEKGWRVEGYSISRTLQSTSREFFHRKTGNIKSSSSYNKHKKNKMSGDF